MQFTMLGSGGALRIPRACCACKICNEARLKGFPYKRMGQSLFLNESSILFDTPEDINEELNNLNINEVKNIFYSHWHPDHTLGCRIIEVLANDKKGEEPINVFMPQEQIELAFNKSSSVFSFYENMGFCKIISSNKPIIFEDITISRIKLLNNFSYAFLIESQDKKVLYCPCHSISIPIVQEFYNLDLMILCIGYVNRLEDNITNFNRDIKHIFNQLNPKKVILTHIEEVDGLSYDDYKKMEDENPGFIFGYDGMKINI
ncbi:MAG TPA: hypothetical protein DEG71_11020 [Clostridiales bacterium]|nr:hypothetical protein [Clostridiales bacterium]